LSAPPIINGKEVFDLLHDDLAALEGEFGQDTVSGVQAITEIGEYLRAGGGKRIRPVLLFPFFQAVQLRGSRSGAAGGGGGDHSHRDSGS
jgi:octaprenyl-diphosphate synthase